MGLINRLSTFITRRAISSEDMNAEINQILGIVNGGIENINVKVNAGIRQDQGKVILDYDAIRAELTASADSLDGSVLIDGTVPLDKMEYAEDVLIAMGYFNNTAPGTFPVVVPANTFQYMMLVYYGATVASLNDDDVANPRVITLQINGNSLAAATINNVSLNISEPGDTTTYNISGTVPVYIHMTDSSNDYAAAIPLLVKNQSHSFEITEPNGYTLTKKHIHILGR